jgi:propanol-preferring alcohol dehydrogenase
MLELQDIPVPVPGSHDVLVRVRAAGICHSDVHYRAGHSSVEPLPLTLGHEVAGVVIGVGSDVENSRIGERVCIHYMATCGECHYCNTKTEQFCTSGTMIGKYRDGGYAEYICVPERSVFRLPDDIPYEHGAIMMCSSATSLHALNKSRIKPGETVAVFGVGGLGISAVQLAFAKGAGAVFAVDIKTGKLEHALRYGAVPVHAVEVDPVEAIRELTNGKGVDVAMELIGLPTTMKQAAQSLAVFGRAVYVGIGSRPFEVDVYHELINKEAELIGVSDHLADEIPILLQWAQEGKLDLGDVITDTIPLDADRINAVLDRLAQFSDAMRVVIQMD